MTWQGLTQRIYKMIAWEWVMEEKVPILDKEANLWPLGSILKGLTCKKYSNKARRAINHKTSNSNENKKWISNRMSKDSIKTKSMVSKYPQGWMCN